MNDIWATNASQLRSSNVGHLAGPVRWPISAARPCSKASSPSQALSVKHMEKGVAGVAHHHSGHVMTHHVVKHWSTSWWLYGATSCSQHQKRHSPFSEIDFPLRFEFLSPKNSSLMLLSSLERRALSDRFGLPVVTPERPPVAVGRSGSRGQLEVACWDGRVSSTGGQCFPDCSRGLVEWLKCRCLAWLFEAVHGGGFRKYS